MSVPIFKQIAQFVQTL